MAAEKTHLIVFGNHYLRTDDMRTHIDYTDDALRASFHTKEWADKFVADMRKENKRVEAMTLADALKLRQSYVHNELVSRYWHAYAAVVNEVAPDVDFYVSGLGTAWATDVHASFGQGIPARDAATKWVAAYLKRNKTPRKKAVTA